MATALVPPIAIVCKQGTISSEDDAPAQSLEQPLNLLKSPPCKHKAKASRKVRCEEILKA